MAGAALRLSSLDAGGTQHVKFHWGLEGIRPQGARGCRQGHADTKTLSYVTEVFSHYSAETHKATAEIRSARICRLLATCQKKVRFVNSQQ